MIVLLVGCSRYRWLSSVDLPHPFGPMMAVILFVGKVTEIFFNTSFVPYEK